MAKIVEFLMTLVFRPFKRAKRYGLLYYNIWGNRQKRVALLRFKGKLSPNIFFIKIYSFCLNLTHTKVWTPEKLVFIPFYGNNTVHTTHHKYTNKYSAMEFYDVYYAHKY